MNVRHLLYGNLAQGDSRPSERDGRGFRVLLRRDWRDEEHPAAEQLLDWARQLQPIEGQTEAWATTSVRSNGTLYRSVARVDASFAQDAFGRPRGSLTHVLACPVQEERDTWLHEASLVALALAVQPAVPPAGSPREIPPNSDEVVAAYIQRLDQQPRVQWAPPSVPALRVLEPLLEPFLRAAATVQTSPAARPATLQLPTALLTSVGRHAAEVLAALGGGLPPRLRLLVRWGWNALPCDGINLHVTPGEPELRSIGEAGARYAGDLRHLLADGRSQEIQAMIENWQIRSWDALQLPVFDRGGDFR